MIGEARQNSSVSSSKRCQSKKKRHIRPDGDYLAWRRVLREGVVRYQRNGAEMLEACDWQFGALTRVCRKSAAVTRRTPAVGDV